MAIRYIGCPSDYDAVNEVINCVAFFQLTFHQPTTSNWEIMHWNVVRHNSKSKLVALVITDIILFCHNCRQCEPMAPIKLIKLEHPDTYLNQEHIVLKLAEIYTAPIYQNLTWKLENFSPLEMSGTFKYLNVFDNNAYYNRNLFWRGSSIPSFKFHIEALL